MGSNAILKRFSIVQLQFQIILNDKNIEYHFTIYPITYVFYNTLRKFNHTGYELYKKLFIGNCTSTYVNFTNYILNDLLIHAFLVKKRVKTSMSKNQLVRYKSATLRFHLIKDKDKTLRQSL